MKPTMLRPMNFFTSLVRSKLSGQSVPLTVIFNITNNCNLRCKHCYATYFSRKIEDTITTKQIKKIILELKKNGCLRINFAGGEPLLRSDVGEIINYAKLQGFSVDLTSNGILVPKRLEELKNLDSLLISLDGKPKNHDVLRGQGSASKALAAIQASKEAGINVRVNMVIHKYNLNDIDYMIGLAKKLGFMVHISLVISNIYSNKPLVEIKPTDREFRKALKHIIKQKEKGAPILFSTSAYKSVLNWPDFNIEGVMEAPAPKGMPTCPAGKIFGLIDADGKLWACPHLIDKVEAGNVLKVGVAKAWEKAKSHPCTGCYQVYHHDFGHLWDMKLPVVWNYVKAVVRLR